MAISRPPFFRTNPQGILIFLCGFFLIIQPFFTPLRAQDSLHCQIPSFPKYSFLKPDSNRIHSDSLMAPVFEKMARLKSGEQEKLRILHLGDSHLQADFLTRLIRLTLQREFGNAGRGLVMPYRQAKTNEPSDYGVYSDVGWLSRRASVSGPAIATGLTGLAIQSSNPLANLAIRTRSDAGLDYSFNQGRILYTRSDTCFPLQIRTGFPPGDSLMAVNPDSQALFRLSGYTNEMFLEANPFSIEQQSITLQGVLLEKDSAGILYNMAAVNGAEFRHYCDSALFGHQLLLVNPDLVVLSFGTNEAQRRPIPLGQIGKELDSLVNLIRLNLPSCPILLITPPDSYRKKRYYNPAVQSISRLIRAYSTEKGLACWDLFGAGGGYKSAYRWKKNHLLTKDGVHFYRKGYEVQAAMFLNAFLSSYHAYLDDRTR